MGRACAGKVAIVTGASRGIGVGIARRLAAEGARVVVTARTTRHGEFHLRGSLEETVAAITAHGGEAVAAVVDLSDPDADRGVIVDTAVEAFGRLPVWSLIGAIAPMSDQTVVRRSGAPGAVARDRG